jgi:hypothetical protein
MNRKLFKYHPIIGYQFIPNLKTRIIHESGGYLLRTNNWGFRSEFDFQEKKSDPNVKRILLFGDSFTAGDGVSNKKRYSDVFQMLTPNCEIYNFGLPGTGTDQQYLVYKEFATKVEFDLLIISVLVENIRRVNSQFRIHYDEKGKKILIQKPYFEIEGEEFLLRNNPVPKGHIFYDNSSEFQKSRVDTGGRLLWLRELVKKFGLKDFVQKFIRYQPLPEYSKSSNPEWVLMENILTNWVKDIDKSKVIVMPIPLYQFVEGTSNSKNVQNRFQELGEKLGIRILDPLHHLRSYSNIEKREFRFLNDVHLTEKGHAAIAKFLKYNLEL